MTDIYKETGERLNGYYPFNEDVVHAVARVAAIQDTMGYADFLAANKIGEPQTVRPDKGDKAIGVLDIVPQDVDYDETQASVVHLAMGNDLSPNQIYQIATTYAADPTLRTIAFANPGIPGHKAGILSLRNCLRVARSHTPKGSTRPLIDRQSRYVTGQGIITTIQRGFSYGCLPALASTQYAETYDQQVSHATVIEPADNKKRSSHTIPAMLSLAGDFGATAKALPGYVEASGVEAFTKEARGDDGIFDRIKYLIGLGRLSNLAISSALSGHFFYGRAASALKAQPNAQLNVVWGTESELVDDVNIRAQISLLKFVHGQRVAATPVEGGKHNMVNDIHLQAALWLQAKHAASR